MKAQVKKVKDFRGRRIVGYRASIGPIEREGKTPAEAIEACECAALAALARVDRGVCVKTWRGHTFVVVPTGYGWSYWLDTFSQGYSVQVSSGSDDSREHAEDAAVHHLAQQVWELSVEDDAAFTGDLPKSVREQIRSWIKFQRAHAKFTAEGKNDVEAHRLACEASYV